MSKKISIIVILYIFLPLILFLFLWTKTVVFIICFICLSYGIYQLFAMWHSGYANSNEVNISYKTILLVLLLSLCLGIFMGYGGLFLQSGDWHKHNAILNDLINKKWPVYYDNAGEHSMLSYYIGQYLIAGAVGKITNSFEVGKWVLCFWNVIGIVLVWILLVKCLKANTIKKQILCYIVLFVFGGLTYLAQIIVNMFYPELQDLNHYHNVASGSGIQLQYSTNFVLLRWVSPQVIVPWMITILFFMYRKECKNYVTLLLPCILYGTFSFMGLSIMAIIMAIVLFIKGKKVSCFLEVFSIQNILVFLSLGTVLILYFGGNVLSEKPKECGLGMTRFNNYWPVYFIFCILMFGIYYLVTFKYNKKEPLFWASFILLSVLPFFHMGVYNDLLMRTSIPAQFLCMIFSLQTLLLEGKSRNMLIRKGVIILALSFSLINTLREVKEIIGFGLSKENEANSFVTMEKFANRQQDMAVEWVYNYFSYDLDNDCFVKYIASDK